MDDESRHRFEDLEARLTKSDERMLATRDLVRVGMRLLRGMQQHIAANDEQIAALIDSDLRLQARLDRMSEKVDALTDNVKAFIDSLRKGGNGNPPPSADH